MRIEKKNVIKAVATSVAAFVFIATIDKVAASVPFEFTVKIDSQEEQTYYTTIANTRQALEELELVNELDEVVGPQRIMNGETYEIKTHKNLTLNYDGTALPMSTKESKVKNVLDENKIKYDEDDLISPGLDTIVKDGDFISVKQVEKKIIEVVEEVKFETKQEFDFNQPTSYESVKQKGEVGKEKKYLEVTSISGKDLEPTLVYSEILKEKKDEIKVKGSKLIEQQDIEFKTEYKDNSSLEKGTEKIAQKGEVGKKELIFKVEKEKKLIQEKVIKEPITQIVERGTKVVEAPEVSGGIQFDANGLLVMQRSSRAQRVVNLLLAIPGHKNGASYHASWGIDNLINQLTTPEAIWVIRKIEGAGFGQTGDGMAGIDSAATHRNFIARQVNRRFGGSIHRLLKAWATFSYGGY